MDASGFLALHADRRGFVLPNAWDAGSARILEQVGFPVLATTSAGISFAHGRPDGSLGRDEMLAAVAAIVDAVACPVSADLEAGYGETAADVAATIREAVAIGVVGANVEDVDGASGELFGVDEATARVAAARDAAPAGTFVLNARTDTYLRAAGAADPRAVLDDTVERASRYVAAGADCVFVPGVDDLGVIGDLVAAIDAPLNVVVGLTGGAADVEALRSVGVARISVGGSLARAALGFVARAGRELLAGSFAYADAAIPHGDLQARFRSG